MYNNNSQIKFKTSMLRSSLCDYSHTYILVSGTIIIATLEAGKKDSRQAAFKNCAPFTDWIK